MSGMSTDRRLVRVTLNLSAPDHLTDREVYDAAEVALRGAGFGDVAISERAHDTGPT